MLETVRGAVRRFLKKKKKKKKKKSRNEPFIATIISGLLHHHLLITVELVLYWLFCPTPGVVKSAVGLVSPLFVYRDWER